MSLHRFVHVGDTHVQHGHARNADRLAALDQIIARGYATPQLAAWLWPGDFFHIKSTPEDRLAIAQRLQLMADVAPVIATVGNHDLASDVEIFERLEVEWPIHVVTTPQTIRFKTATQSTAVCFVLPYPHKAGLVSVGVAHAELGQDALHALEPIFMAAAGELADAWLAAEIPLMIGHVNVGGALSSVGQPQIGREIELAPALLARLGPVAIALNHIHRHQEIHGAVYAGSIARMDYGEQEDKGYVEWTYDDVAAAWSWRFVPIDTPAQHHVEGRLTREGFAIESINGTQKLTVWQDRLWTGADIRCRYRYVKAEVSAIDTAHILAEFAGCRSLKLDGIPELEHQVRAPEIAAAVTLEQKVKLYAASRGIPWTPAMEIKLAQLQAQDGEALVAAITQSLALLTAPRPTVEPQQAVA